MNKILFASSNKGKINEVKNFAVDYSFEVLSLEEIGFCEDIEETGDTFEENAEIKVRALGSFLDGKIEYKGLWIAGDDSGITIDALGGEPGVHTRRWAGYRMSDDEIIGYCLGKLDGVPTSKRGAHFVSAVALGRVGSEGVNLFRGKTSGHISEVKNQNAEQTAGYPFRSLFVISEGDSSHRQKSFKKVFEYIIASE